MKVNKLRIVRIRCPDCYGKGWIASADNKWYYPTTKTEPCKRCNSLKRIVVELNYEEATNKGS